MTVTIPILTEDVAQDSAPVKSSKKRMRPKNLDSKEPAARAEGSIVGDGGMINRTNAVQQSVTSALPCFVLFLCKFAQIE